MEEEDSLDADHVPFDGGHQRIHHPFLPCKVPGPERLPLTNHTILTPHFLPGLLQNLLHIYRHARLTDHYRHLTQPLMRPAHDVPDLECIIPLGGRLTKVQCAGDEHSLPERSALRGVK